MEKTTKSVPKNEWCNCMCPFYEWWIMSVCGRTGPFWRRMESWACKWSILHQHALPSSGSIFAPSTLVSQWDLLPNLQLMKPCQSNKNQSTQIKGGILGTKCKYPCPRRQKNQLWGQTTRGTSRSQTPWKWNAAPDFRGGHPSQYYSSPKAIFLKPE